MTEHQCEACRVDAEKLDTAQIEQALNGLPGWQWLDEDIDKLQRVYTLKDFVAAMQLAEQVAQLAETVNHHPQLIVEYGRLTVVWWSHKIKGLHALDVEMAHRTDKLLPS